MSFVWRASAHAFATQMSHTPVPFPPVKNCPIGFGGIQTVDTEFPYRVPIVDRGTIAVPPFADPVSDS